MLSVSIVLSGVLLLSAEEAFDVHYIYLCNRCLPATDLLYLSLGDCSKHVLIRIGMLLAG